KQMATVMKVLPVFFGFISLRFPAGLVLYFFVSNLWRLGQQEVIFRRYGTAANPTHRSLLHRPSKASVVDAESRERTDTDDDTDDDTPIEEPRELESGAAAAAEGATTSAPKSPAPKTGAGASAKPPASRSKAPAKQPAKSSAKPSTGNGAK